MKIPVTVYSTVSWIDLVERFHRQDGYITNIGGQLYLVEVV